MIDVLHAVDQGVASHCIGNIFVHCIRKGVWGGSTFDSNAAALAEEINVWAQKTVGNRCGAGWLGSA